MKINCCRERGGEAACWLNAAERGLVSLVLLICSFLTCQTDKTEEKIGKEVGGRQRKKRRNSILGKEHVSEMLSVRQLMTKMARAERQSECEAIVRDGVG